MTTGSEMTRPKWGPALRYTIGGALGVFAVVAATQGLAWYIATILLVLTSFVILGRGRMFRAAVTRTSDEIVCRYSPWLQGDAYVVNIALPVMALAIIAASYAPGNPVWLRYGGYLLLALMPFMLSGTYRRWRLSLLRITPSTLTLRVPASNKEPIVLPREAISSITPKTERAPSGSPILQVQIAYRATDSTSDTDATIVLGQQLTVEPANLLNALVAWHDASGDDPTSDLLDRIEQVLRGRSTTPT
jgi:hypothetical protein